jgi:uncharacterized repeat protein (TIGR02543 family)
MDARGRRRTAVLSRLGVLVGLIALPAGATAQTTALFLDSRPGVQQTLTGSDSTFTSSVSPSTAVVQIRRGFASWMFILNAPQGATLQPGMYAPALAGVFPGLAGFHVSGGSCYDATGRFEILEIAADDAGQTTRLAVDLEAHCTDATVFAAIRINSTIGSLAPFGGNYPRYELSLVPSPNGTITGAGIDCGAGHTLCGVALTAPSGIALTATPDPGYVFGGWLGSCLGRAAAAVIMVESVEWCAAEFVPEVAPEARTLLFLDSEPGDAVGRGERTGYSPRNASFFAFGSGGITFRVESLGVRWTIELNGPAGPLSVGTYDSAGRPALNALSISDGESHCTTVTGRFVVLDLAYRPNGTLERFAADLEQHCNDAAPGLFAALRYNSSADARPFGGRYPEYTLSVIPSPHGVVAGEGISCGAGGTSCARSFAAPTSLALTATPNPGYVFGGWARGCLGTDTTIVNVNSAKICGASFVALTPAVPQSVLVLDSAPADPIGGGRKATYGPPAALFAVSGDSAGVVVDVAGNDFSWRFEFFPPPGAALGPGTYPSARTGFVSPYARFGMTPFRAFCSGVNGYFSVRDIAYDAEGRVVALAVDAEFHCDIAPPLTVAIRHNSIVPPLAFDGRYPRYELSITPSGNGIVTGDGITCGAGQLQCSLAFPALAEITLTATANPGYVFTGWTGGCLGPATTAVLIHMSQVCEATFEPIVPPADRTLVTIEGDPWEFLTRGRSYAYTPANSSWDTMATPQIATVTLRVLTEVSTTDWHFSLRTRGDVLSPGRYVTTGSADDQLFLGMGTASRGCNASGVIVVHEFERDLGSGALVRLSADFDVQCAYATGRVRGAIRLNSRIRLPPLPLLTLSSSNLEFAGVRTGQARWQPRTPARTISIAQAGDGLVAWSVKPRAPWIAVSPASGTGPATVTVAVLPQFLPAGAVNGTFIDITAVGAGNTLSPVPVTVTSVQGLPVAGDFDLDGASDLALFRPGTGDWQLRFSSVDFGDGQDLPFGLPTDKPVPGDYDGDGINDFAVYRSSNGMWYVIFSSTRVLSPLQWGMNGDVPMPADYTGDGRTDLAVWRPSTGVWFIFDLANGTYTSRQWGISTDVPMTGDYDGDGKADVAAYRRSTGVWWVFFSSTQTYAPLQWGMSTDVPLAGDFTGDGRTDLAVYRPANGYWFVFDLRTGTYVPYQWGLPTDVPVPKDYDGDGRTDLAVWRPSTGTWFVYFVGTSTYRSISHGASSDVPIR